VHPGALHRLLRFLAADGFLELAEDGRFSLAAAAEPLLATSRAGLREALLSTATRGWEVWRQLGHSVETGRPAFETVFGRDYFAEQRANPEALARFDVALAAGAAELGRELARTLRPAQLVCDLGCGSAALLMELLQAWPNARGIAFDAPGPLALAEQRLSAAGMASRYEACAGDFFAAVPAGADLYILAQVLHDWDDPEALRILRNCQAAMRPGSRLVILEQPLPDNPRSAPRAAHADLAMLVMTGGRERTLQEYRQLLERAGLRFDGATPVATSRQATAIEASRGLM
jgi:SAM-dependent methyltransferase